MSFKHAFGFSAFAAMALCAAAQDAAAPEPAEAAPAAEPAPAAVEAPAAEAAPAEAVAASDEVVVRIDGVDAVTQAEVDEAVARFLEQSAGRIPPDQLESVKRRFSRDVVRNFAMQWILKRAADDAGVVVTDADRAAAFERFGLSDRASAIEAFGVSEAEFDKMFDTNLAIQKLLESQTNGVAAPTDEEVRARFDEIVAEHPEAVQKPESVTASHILVKVDSGASDEDKAAARAKIDALRERALAGEDFAELAKENSDCPSSARGGDLGSFGRGQMVKPFEDAAFSQEIGAVGPVVETQFGFHVVKVTAREEGGTIAFDEVKDELAEGMLRQREQEAVGAFMEKVQSAANVEYLGSAAAPEVVSEPVAVPPASEDTAPVERKLPAWAEE